MAVTKIKIAFTAVNVLDDCDIFGSGDWHFTARIDGQAVGSPATEFEAQTGQSIALPAADWSRIVDVSAKGPGTSVVVNFSGIDKDFFGDDDLGAVTATFSHPYSTPQTVVLRSPLVDGGFFFSDYRAYSLQIVMTVEEIMATTDLTGPTAIPVSRQADGSSTLSTIGSLPVVPRIEVCPVIPVPSNGFTRLPPRPVQPAGLAPGAATAHAAPVNLPGAALNGMVNPSVIPIIDEAHPDFANRVARLAVTYADPGNIDLGMLTWHVVSGPVVIVGSERGGVVKVRGNVAGADQIAEFEVRWDGPSGQVLAKYRAWVGKVGKVPYRINLLDGTTPGSLVTGLRPAATVDSHMAVAKVIYWQAGLELVPDPDATAFDGAVASGIAGIFTVTATNNGHTRNVPINLKPAATRYNFKPGVLNVVFIRSILTSPPGQFGVATDIQGIPIPDSTDSGTPSNSWVLPSGILPDGAAGSVKIKTFAGEKTRLQKAAAGDKAYIKARNIASPPFVVNDMLRIHAAILPAAWGNNAVSPNGINLAHEMGHVLGLRHRGNGATGLAPRSDDGINSKDLKNKQRGHPWLENVMSYGYPLTPDLAMDIDLLQASVIRRHPIISY